MMLPGVVVRPCSGRSAGGLSESALQQRVHQRKIRARESFMVQHLTLRNFLYQTFVGLSSSLASYRKSTTGSYREVVLDGIKVGVMKMDH
jgi:hypothetical protein